MVLDSSYYTKIGILLKNNQNKYLYYYNYKGLGKIIILSILKKELKPIFKSFIKKAIQHYIFRIATE